MKYSSSATCRPGRVAWLGIVLLPLIVIGAFAVTRLGGLARRPSVDHRDPVLEARRPVDSGGASTSRPPAGRAGNPLDRPAPIYEERKPIDSSGFSRIIGSVTPMPREASLAEIADAWSRIGQRAAQAIDREFASGPMTAQDGLSRDLSRTMLLHSQGQTAEATSVLEQARRRLELNDDLARKHLYTIIYYQGLTALRHGENENCIECRGESSCILPIAPSARHTKPDGSRRAIGFFTEYLRRFPDDFEVRWLLNLAHMTLGEYPDRVDPAYLIRIDRYLKSEFDIGKFRDVGHLAGVNRLNQAGGAIMEDFDGDDLLDLAVTSFDPTQAMSFYRNKGDGTFEDRSQAAGVSEQFGGFSCVQTDYNNDGRMDIFISRGAWLDSPMRPSLLRNDGATFVDVTAEAGLLDPVNSISASWADYDNDGWLDLFVCCEKQPNRLYHNKRDGSFEEVAREAGVADDGLSHCKGAAWIDFDNDGHPDLFLNNLNKLGKLFHNEGNGRFLEVTSYLGINGPRNGFSCWAWDFDNDGWLDIFATSYDRTLKDVIKGLNGEPHTSSQNKLFRNLGGSGFADVTRAAGLDLVFGTMGSNFADFDNDGFLDFYLATGDPSLSTLIPNRMFKNVGGRRFAEITTSAGTGLLQKGHGVACGDWDRDGDLDLFAQTGGVVNGDKYHNVLFENPGQGNHWLGVKLVGKKSNRAAIGARIKLVTAGDEPSTVHRHVSSGSSFGANALRQHIGLAAATRVASLEVHWPTSGTTQVFRDLDADQSIEITEFEAGYRKLEGKPLPKPR